MPFAHIVHGKVHEIFDEYPVMAPGQDIREVSPVVAVGWELSEGNLVEPTPLQADPSKVAAVLIANAQEVVLYFYTQGEPVAEEWATYLSDLRAIKNSGLVPDGVWPTKPALPEGF